MSNKSAREKIRQILKNNKEVLEKNFGVDKIGLFGSYLRGEASEKSDIDILVEFKKPIGFLKFIKLENYLSKVLNKKVDLVTKKALKPLIRKEILKEALYA